MTVFLTRVGCNQAGKSSFFGMERAILLKALPSQFCSSLFLSRKVSEAPSICGRVNKEAPLISHGTSLKSSLFKGVPPREGS